MLQRSAAQNGQYSAPTYTIIGLPLASFKTVFPGRRTIWPGCPPEPTVWMTEALGCSIALATAAEIGVLVVTLPPAA